MWVSVSLSAKGTIPEDRVFLRRRKHEKGVCLSVGNQDDFQVNFIQFGIFPPPRGPRTTRSAAYARLVLRLARFARHTARKPKYARHSARVARMTGTARDVRCMPRVARSSRYAWRHACTVRRLASRPALLHLSQVTSPPTSCIPCAVGYLSPYASS